LSRAAAPNFQPARIALSQIAGNSSRETEEGMSNTDILYNILSPNKILLSLWRKFSFNKNFEAPIEASIVFLFANYRI